MAYEREQAYPSGIATYKQSFPDEEALRPNKEHAVEVLFDRIMDAKDTDVPHWLLDFLLEHAKENHLDYHRMDLEARFGDIFSGEGGHGKGDQDKDRRPYDELLDWLQPRL